MSETLKTTMDQDELTIDLVLVGGPVDLPAVHRSRRVARLDEKIKVEHRGGYEHFRRVDGERVDGEHGRADPVVFEWISRTEIAE